MVVDADIWESIRNIKRDVVFDDDHFAVDLIEEIGPGGNFLRSPHTLRNMHAELFVPPSEKADLFDLYRGSQDQKTVVEQARNRVKRILSEHKPEPLDGDAEKTIEEIMAGYR